MFRDQLFNIQKCLRRIKKGFHAIWLKYSRQIEKMMCNHNRQSMKIILSIFFFDDVWHNPWISYFIASMGYAMELWEMPLYGKTHTPWLLPLCMTFAMHNGFSHRIPYYALDSRCRVKTAPGKLHCWPNSNRFDHLIWNSLKDDQKWK